MDRGGRGARNRYVVRMSDGQRDWEMQMPETASSYEVRVPMSGNRTGLVPQMATMTAADREILQEREAAARAESGEPEPSKDDGARPERGERGGKAGARRRRREARRAKARRPRVQR